MQEMQIIAPTSGREASEINFGVKVKGERRDIFFRSLSDTKLQGNFETYLSAAILPCMKAGGGELIAKGEVSKKFLSGLEMIQDIHHSWDTRLERVKIKRLSLRVEEPVKKRRVGTFFSGGLDSFYTLLKRQDITDLIFIHGTDITLEDTKLRKMVAEKNREIALYFGKNLIEIETNIRPFLESHHLLWGNESHGAALAAVAHMLSFNFHRIYIPSTTSYAQMIPWGSHPLVDPLWSSDSLDIVHDGAEATRLDKVGMISKNAKALDSLRVCYSNVDSCYNCSKCEKCVQTMISLKIHNALERCTTFKNEICIKDIYKINFLQGTFPCMVAQVNLVGLEKTQGNKKLKRALRRILNRPEWLVKINDAQNNPKIMMLVILKIILPNLLVCYLRLARTRLNNLFPTRS